MSFFRNYTNGTVSEGVLDDKSQRGSIDRADNNVGNDDLDATSSLDKEFETKMDARQYGSDGEPYAVSRLQYDAAAGDGDGGLSNLHASTTAKKAAGRWGSTFWKDCQPMHKKPGSESMQESKSSSGYKNEDGSENDLSEVDKVHKAQNVDEMLSDDYYEQEEDDQGDPLRRKLLSNTDGYSSKSRSGLIADSANNFVPGKKSKASYGGEYEDDDVYFEDEEDDIDEDDPDDVDFDPDFGTTTVGRGNKEHDEDWEGGDLDEVDNSDDDELDISDGDDDDFYKKPRGMQRRKGGRRSVKSSSEPKLSTFSNRRKRGRTSFEEEYSSANDSEDDDEEDFKSTGRRSGHIRKKN